jgi:hypothetical protein
MKTRKIKGGCTEMKKMILALAVPLVFLSVASPSLAAEKTRESFAEKKIAAVLAPEEKPVSGINADELSRGGHHKRPPEKNRGGSRHDQGNDKGQKPGKKPGPPNANKPGAQKLPPRRHDFPRPNPGPGHNNPPRHS